MVTAVDYEFEGLPERIRAETALALVNESPAEIHELVAIRLPADETRSVDELVQLPPEDFAAFFPGLATVVIAPPGASGFAVEGTGVLSEPGRYAVICAIPTGADPDEYLAAAAESERGTATGRRRTPTPCDGHVRRGDGRRVGIRSIEGGVLIEKGSAGPSISRLLRSLSFVVSSRRRCRLVRESARWRRTSWLWHPPAVDDPPRGRRPLEIPRSEQRRSLPNPTPHPQLNGGCIGRRPTDPQPTSWR